MKRKSTFSAKSLLIIVFTMTFGMAMAQNQTVKLDNPWGKQGITLLKQSPQNLQVNFSVDDYVVTPTPIDKENMSTITMTGVILQNSEGAPNLPAYSKFIAVPQGATVSVNITDKRVETVPGLKIAPAPRIPKDDDLSPLEYKKNPEIYTKNAYYPEQPVIVSSPQRKPVSIQSRYRRVDCKPRHENRNRL